MSNASTGTSTRVKVGTSTQRTDALDDAGQGVLDRRRSREQAEAEHGHVRVLGQASLPRSCRLSLDQVNYLMVDYLVRQPRPARDRVDDGGHGGAGGREGVRLGGTEAELMVFVNDPARSGVPVLSIELDMGRLIELGG